MCEAKIKQDPFSDEILALDSFPGVVHLKLPNFVYWSVMATLKGTLKQ